jgi:ADP-heptose:LPS heptosyltransferase
LNNSKQYGYLHVKTDNNSNNSHYVIICPLSNEKAKDLSIDNLILLVNVIKTKKLIPVIIGDKKIKLNITDVINLTGETDWNDLKNLINNSKYIISVDTSIFHLALLYHRNVFLLMSSRLLETKRWIPINFNNYKYNNVECKGCNASVCKISEDSYCINSNFNNIDFSFLN